MLLNSKSQAHVLPALLAVIAALPAFKTSAHNQSCDSWYTPLDDILKAARGLFAENKLIVMYTSELDGRNFYVTQRIFHVPSQEFVGSRFPFMVDGGSPHEMGSLLTYARRYLLAMSLNFIQGCDDDGQEAQLASGRAPNATVVAKGERTEEPHGGTPNLPEAAPLAPSAPAAAVAAEVVEPNVDQEAQRAKSQLMNNLYARLKKTLGGKVAEEVVMEAGRVRFVRMVPPTAFDAVIAAIESRLAKVGDTGDAAASPATAA